MTVHDEIAALARLAEVAAPERRPMVEAGAQLDDVVDDFARAYCLPLAAEELAGREVSDRVASSWQTFGDVLDWIGGARADQKDCGPPYL